MKKTTLSLMLAFAIISTSCLGSFAAVNALKDWNENLSDNKFVNNIIFFGLLVIPVYGISMFGDLAIFNPIEYWTGENPITMKEGKTDRKIVRKNGKKYQITATKNHFNIEVLKGENKGEKMDLVFNEQDKSWNAITPQGKKIKLSSYKDGFIYVYAPNGKNIKIDAHTDKAIGIAKIKPFIYNHIYSHQMVLNK